MNFLHKKLLQARTRDQEDKIVDWMLAEVNLKQAAEKNSQKITSDINKLNNKV
jgi:ABC-type cobalamin/Fe3+-siderophores transport system ATPase subunit